MHMPQSRGVRLTSPIAVSPARNFLRLSGSIFVTVVWPSGAVSLPYQILVMPLILLGRASLALKKASQSAGVASLIEVQAKQCISVFSPARAALAERRKTAAVAARRIMMEF